VAALIAARRADGILVAVACRALGVSRSWFYKYTGGRLPPRAQRRERLKAEVARLVAEIQLRRNIGPGWPQLSGNLERYPS
jgi:ACT domain-containing protein